MSGIEHSRMSLVAVALAMLGASAQADLVYPDFQNPTGLTTRGSAFFSANALVLTPSAVGQSGAVWATAQQRVANGFEATFSFRITEQFNHGADGFAFVIQNSSATALGSGGDGMGFWGIPNSLAIAIDTYIWDDIVRGVYNTSQLAMYGYGVLPDPALAITSAPASFTDGGLHSVRITYHGGVLDVALDGAAAPTLSRPIVLGDLLSLNEGRAWVGFTAGTGADGERHEILSWSFTEPSAPVAEPSAFVLLCVGCGGLLLARLLRRRRGVGVA